MAKPSIPKGTRDFSVDEMAKRNYIFDTIKQVFALYGFRQIETPAMETLQTLMGKYGEEGDKLLFKVLNSGDFLSDVTEADLAERNLNRLAARLCEKGLRYDLTVPFARFVVMHRNELTFPFKRYQIQPVWRADRPQKGRYREFYQCDADVVGSDSLLNEVELIEMIDEVFSRLGIRVAIKLNNRKILSGIAEWIGAPEKIVDITVAIDKLDKMGLDKVNAELLEKGLPEEAVARLQPIIQLQGSNEEKLQVLRRELAGSETGVKGIDELEYILQKLSASPLRSTLEIDRSRPHLRCAQPARSLSQGVDAVDPGDVCQLWRERESGLSGTSVAVAGCRYTGRNLSRGCQDEEADELCRLHRDPICGSGRRDRDGCRQDCTEKYDDRRAVVAHHRRGDSPFRLMGGDSRKQRIA